jgi:3-dehydrosphinganine reductase
MPHAIVTGGSSGIGLSLVWRLAGAGWRISVIALDDADLTRLAVAPPPSTHPLHLEGADVGDRRAAEAAVAGALDAHGPCDLLVTCAGVTRPGAFTDLAPEEFERQLRINYLGTLWVVRAVAPSMISRGEGTIVLVSSFAALTGVYGYSAYAPTKYAVRGLAESLRTELKPAGVHVACVFPTDVDTPMLAGEEPLKPPETAALSGTTAVLTPEQVVTAILRGVQRGRFEILVDRWSALLAVLGRTTPGLARVILDRTVARSRRGTEGLSRRPRIPVGWGTRGSAR